MNKQANDNAFMLIELHNKGVKLAVVAAQSMGQKGAGDLPKYDDMDGIPVYRLYETPRDMFLFPSKALNKILEIAQELKPDLIFCSQELNMRLALLIQNSLKLPIVLLVEDAGRILSGEIYSSLKMSGIMLFFGIPSGPKFWSWLCEKANALITCNPRDQPMLGVLSKCNKSVFYLPWPSYVPNDFEFASTRESSRGIYVGSLYPFKNTQEFETTLPAIIENTKTKQFVVVGPGPHASIVKKLQQKYGKEITYVEQLPRTEVLKLISSSYYAYSPVKIGGWGFIGDCWSVKTPLIMTHNDEYVTNNVNALVPKNLSDLVKSINCLYEDTGMYQKLQINGYVEYQKRKADVVADKLYSIFTSVL